MGLPGPGSLAPPDWGSWDSRYLFFTGKGGVGKTTISVAVAVALADSGRRTLILCTDPASNLADVLGVAAGADPTPVPGVARLSIANLDPEAAAAAFRERVVSPYRGILPETAITGIEEQLFGACTVEIAAFNEFTAVLTAPPGTVAYDHVIFDTAPTGHTLRLLSLPSAWSGYVEAHPEGASCLGPLAGLDQRREQYADAVRTLSDPTLTTLVLVSRAEESALREAARASGELAALGVANQRLIVNGLLGDHAGDAVALAFALRQAKALAGAPAQLSALAVAGVPLMAGDLTGVDALRRLARGAGGPSAHGAGGPSAHGAQSDTGGLPGLDELVDELDGVGNGVVMTMGKGGVGKTTVAAALALALAERGHDVTLSTTDPAAHIVDALAGAAHERLVVERIDPAAEIARYAEEVLSGAKWLDDEGRALLEEDLRSPCTEEIAVFRAFARAVDAARERVVVLDTAPTGHTLLLLDAAQSYQREVQRGQTDVSADVSELLTRLRDPAFARLLVVTLAESTPVQEAERLQADLRRAGIEPFGWVISASLTATDTRHPTLRARASAEHAHIERVEQAASRVWLTAWQPEPPIGPRGLHELAGTGTAAAA